MHCGSIKVVNKLGLHARAASKFVTCTTRFDCSIRVRNDNEWVDGKSIMSVMMLAAGQGTTLHFELEGPDAESAFRALEQLLADRFGENE
ncbi:MAG: HPr family phosphocarrier protein [Pseudomonadota bacterium]